MTTRGNDACGAGPRRLLGTCALTSAAGFGLAAAPSLPPPVIQGTPSDDYPAVVLLWLQQGDTREEGAMVCTGFLVSPEWLVTAAHCTAIMDETVAEGSVRAVWAMVGSGLHDPGARWVQAATWVGHEDFEVVQGSSPEDPPWEGTLHVNDIGLVQLSEPVLDVAPLPVADDDLVEQLGTGDLVRVAGFGWQSDSGSEGTLRWADLMPVHIDDQALWMRDPDGDQNICLGDSGGPALLPGSEGGWLAAAVDVQLVWYDLNYGCQGSGARSIRLDRQRAWLERWVELMDYDAWLDEYGDTLEPDDTAPPEDTAPPVDTAPPEDTALPGDSAPRDSGQEDGDGQAWHGREGRGCGCGGHGGRPGLAVILGALALAGARRRAGAGARVALLLLPIGCGPATVPADLGLPATVEHPSAGLCVSVQLDRWDGERRAAQVAALREAGVRELRQDLRWSHVQPTRDAWDWTTEDAIQDAAWEAGFGMIAMLGYGAPWASSQEGADEFAPPDDPADFAAFAAAAAERYAGRGIRWEVWNEPNAGYRFWKVGDPPAFGGDPVAYAALFVAAADAIHAVDPEAEVWIGGTFWHPQVIPGTVEFLTAAAESEPRFLEVADGVAVHPYTQYPPRVGPEDDEGGEVPLWDMLAETRAVTGDLPLAITEMGWPSWQDVDEDDQAAFLVREFALSQADGVRDVCWYTLEDGAAPEGNPEDAFGLARAGPGPWKPSGEAYRALAEALDRLAPAACHGRAEQALDLPDGVFAVRWSDGLDALTVLWTVEGEVGVTLPGLETEGAPATVAVTSHPVLVPQEGVLPGR